MIITELNKPELRRFMKERRSELGEEEKGNKDFRIAFHLKTIADRNENDAYFVYNSFGGEVDTSMIVRYLLTTCKKVYLPRVEGKEMVAVRVRPETIFRKNKMGISEPIGPSEDIDDFVAIVPCLALDENGNRLGYGGGYYDKFLASKHCVKIALAYNFQVVKKLDVSEHDVPMDMVVTEESAFKFDNNKKRLVD